MKKHTFKNTEELIEQAKKDNACSHGIAWCEEKKLDDILENIPLEFRVWGLAKNYMQFAEHFDWGKLDGDDWADLLREQPHFAEQCDWDKLNGYDWRLLLRKQPQFAENFDWSKLDGHDWAYLLMVQPHFADHCDWEKLNGYDWADLLRVQPQMEKYKK